MGSWFPLVEDVANVLFEANDRRMIPTTTARLFRHKDVDPTDAAIMLASQPMLVGVVCSFVRLVFRNREKSPFEDGFFRFETEMQKVEVGLVEATTM